MKLAGQVMLLFFLHNPNHASQHPDNCACTTAPAKSNLALCKHAPAQLLPYSSILTVVSERFPRRFVRPRTHAAMATDFFGLGRLVTTVTRNWLFQVYRPSFMLPLLLQHKRYGPCSSFLQRLPSKLSYSVITDSQVMLKPCQPAS